MVLPDSSPLHTVNSKPTGMTPQASTLSRLLSIGRTRHSYASGASAKPLLDCTLGEMLGDIADQYPEHEALVEAFTGRRWTFAELYAQSELLAATMVKRGVRKGDRVGVWSPNCAEWVFTYYAAAMVGAILVSLNPAYRTSELQFAVEKSGISFMVSAVSYKSSDYSGMLDEIGFHKVLFIGTQQWDAALAEARQLLPLVVPEPPTFDDAVNIQFTSGTTGAPKGATLTHHNLVNNGFFLGEGLRYTPQDRLCLPVPLYHSFGLSIGVMGAHTHAVCIVIPAPVFDAEKTLAAVQSEQCTVLYGVPTMFIAELELLKLRDFDVLSLRKGIMAGTACPIEVMEQAIADLHMSEIAICFGMTETSPVATMTAIDDDLATRTQTVGKVMPHLEVKIIDDGGRLVPRGVSGEVCTRGYAVMLGYWDAPEQTALAIDKNGWMHTGDIATMGADDRLRFEGRSSDMVIRGGENIYPREIEEFFYRHPDIADVQVIGVPDSRLGEELMAWVVPRAGAKPLTAGALREFASGQIAHFKIPRYVHVVKEFPLTVSGKVRKAEMRRLSALLLDS